jgi:tetratricopeptide (TPR) repeat protein
MNFIATDRAMSSGWVTLAILFIAIASANPAHAADSPSGSPPQKFRAWRSADGKRSDEAALDYVKDGHVHVVRRNGKRGKVAISSLSEEDQKYIAALQATAGDLFEADDTPPAVAPQRIVAEKPVLDRPLPVNGMSPDQEAYNNLLALAYSLESNPLNDEHTKAFRHIRQKGLSSFMQEKVVSMGQLLKSVGNIDTAIERRKSQAEADSSGAGFQKGLEGGLEGAETLAQLDMATNGEPAAGALAYMIAGAVGGAVRAQQAAAAIQEEADHQCAAMRDEQKELIRVWIRDMEELGESLVGKTFVAERLYQKDGPAKDPAVDANSSAVHRWNGWLKMRVATLSVIACDLEKSDPLGTGRKLPTPKEWQEMIDLAIAEWPTCVDQKSSYFASLLKMRAKALIGQENFSEAEQSISKSISCHADDSDAYVTRANVYFYTGRAANGIRDVEAAIHLDPQNSSHRMFKAHGHALNNDAAAVYRGLQEAYELGWSDTAFVKQHAPFQPFKDSAEFKRLTTVKWSWSSSVGVLAGDVYLVNESPFPITNVRLKVNGSAQHPVLEAARIRPGEKMHWEWVDNTAADAARASLECDQMK